MGTSRHVCQSQLKLLQQLEAQEHVLENRAEQRGKYLIIGWIALVALYICI